MALWRRAWRDKILPAVVRHRPDLILISAGFDAHRKDGINQRFVGVQERDYEWLTGQIVQVTVFFKSGTRTPHTLAKCTACCGYWHVTNTRSCTQCLAVDMSTWHSISVLLAKEIQHRLETSPEVLLLMCFSSRALTGTRGVCRWPTRAVAGAWSACWRAATASRAAPSPPSRAPSRPTSARSQSPTCRQAEFNCLFDHSLPNHRLSRSCQQCRLLSSAQEVTGLRP